jgi:hypothetical protein
MSLFEFIYRKKGLLKSATESVAFLLGQAGVSVIVKKFRKHFTVRSISLENPQQEN